MALKTLLCCAAAVLGAVADPACGRDPDAPFCSADESCCQDSPTCSGACTECCVAQSTMCVLPRAGFTTSTCCPKWTVGCSIGSVGCCDPARPWQLGAGAAATPISVSVDPITGQSPRRQPTKIHHASRGRSARTVEEEEEEFFAPMAGTAGASADGANATGYAIFTRNILSGLQAVTFDAGSGKVTTKHPITGPFNDYYTRYYGESTRLFPWDGKSKKFYYADVPVLPANGTTIKFYTIDPSDGSSTATDVLGCEGFPTGVAWDEKQSKLVIAVQTKDTVEFCAIEPSTAKAASLGSLSRGASEASTAFYAAYMSHASGGVAARVGHQMVTTGEKLGLGLTTLAAGAPKSTWSAIDLGLHGLPAATRSHPTKSGGFLSLAPRNAAGSDPFGSAPLDMIEWTAGGKPTVLANLTNAHPPTLPTMLGGGVLGYVEHAVDADLYASMTVAIGAAAMGVGDKWSVSTLDLKTGKLVEAALNPQPSLEGAETVSLSGFGIVAPVAAASP
jgi:hypothetical protein